jgi:hypothetical protein
MYQVELIREKPSAHRVIIEFYAVPICGLDDYQCEPRRIISFEQAKRISHGLAIGNKTGEIGEWKWRVGEFSVCPICDRPIEEDLPLCPACESVLAGGNKTLADGRGLGS